MSDLEQAHREWATRKTGESTEDWLDRVHGQGASGELRRAALEDALLGARADASHPVNRAAFTCGFEAGIKYEVCGEVCDKPDPEDIAAFTLGHAAGVKYAKERCVPEALDEHIPKPGTLSHAAYIARGGKPSIKKKGFA